MSTKRTRLLPATIEPPVAPVRPLKRTKRLVKSNKSKSESKSESTPTSKSKSKPKAKTKPIKAKAKTKYDYQTLQKQSPTTRDCMSCCETFNQTNRYLIPCQHCTFEACRQCHQRYILSSLAPHCMNCRTRWTYRQLYERLPVSFIEKDYRQWIKKICTDRSRAFLPAAMPFAEVMKNLERSQQDLAMVRALQSRLDTLAVWTEAIDPQPHHFQKAALVAANCTLAHRRRAILAQQSELKPQTFAEHHRRNRQAGHQNNGTGQPRYNIQCPISDCRGMVNRITRRCGICRQWVCLKCEHPLNPKNGSNLKLEMKSNLDPDPDPVQSNSDLEGDADLDLEPDLDTDPESAAAMVATEKLAGEELKEYRLVRKHHRCCPDVVASLKEIRQNCKECPQCKAKIYRVSGCDVMFCTMCKTGYNWVTNMIIRDTREMHNPHFAEFVQQNPHYYEHKAAADAKEQQPQQQQQQCCGEDTLNGFNPPAVETIERAKIREPLRSAILYYRDHLGEIKDNSVQALNKLRMPNHLEYAYRFLTRQITEAGWYTQIEHKARFVAIGQEYGDIILSWLQLMNDLLLNAIQSPGTTSYDTFLEHAQRICEFTNQTLTNLTRLTRQANIFKVQVKPFVSK